MMLLNVCRFKELSVKAIKKIEKKYHNIPIFLIQHIFHFTFFLNKISINEHNLHCSLVTVRSRSTLALRSSSLKFSLAEAVWLECKSELSHVTVWSYSVSTVLTVWSGSSQFAIYC